MNEKASKRWAGRRRYNMKRQSAAAKRQQQIVDLLPKLRCEPGWQTRLADDFDVDRATIWRDIKRITSDFEVNQGLGDCPMNATQSAAAESLIQRRTARRIAQTSQSTSKSNLALKSHSQTNDFNTLQSSPPLTLQAFRTLPNKQQSRHLPSHSIDSSDHREIPYFISRPPSRFDGMGCFAESKTNRPPVYGIANFYGSQ